MELNEVLKLPQILDGNKESLLDQNDNSWVVDHRVEVVEEQWEDEI